MSLTFESLMPSRVLGIAGIQLSAEKGRKEGEKEGRKEGGNEGREGGREGERDGEVISIPLTQCSWAGGFLIDIIKGKIALR